MLTGGNVCSRLQMARAGGCQSAHTARCHSLNQSCSPGALSAVSPACSGLLFCSPEVFTSNHKTEILDEAFDAVLKRLGAPRSKHQIRDRLWVRELTRGRWCESSEAGELLVQHHKQHWAPLVRATRSLWLCPARPACLSLRVGCQGHSWCCAVAAAQCQLSFGSCV
jgi:hypothetical protein